MFTRCMFFLLKTKLKLKGSFSWLDLKKKQGLGVGAFPTECPSVGFWPSTRSG